MSRAMARIVQNCGLLAVGADFMWKAPGRPSRVLKREDPDWVGNQ